MRDLFNVITNLKDIVYQLIGVQSPDPRHQHISTDIHSVLLACNTGYEDLRRVETLLKGHLKGKIVSEAIAESVRESRKNQLASPNRLPREDSKKSIERMSKNFRGNLQNC